MANKLLQKFSKTLISWAGYHTKIQSTTYVYGEMKTDDVQAAIRSWNAGYLGPLQRVISTMISNNTHVQAVTQSRRQAILAVDHFITARDKKAVQKQIEFLEEIFEEMNIHSLISDLIAGIFTGCKPLELKWAADGSRWFVEEYKEPIVENFIWQDGRLKMLGDSGRENKELEPWKYIIHAPNLYNGKPFAALQPAMNWYLFSDFASRNWARHTEIYGMPVRIGKYEPGTPDVDIQALKSELISMGADASAVISTDAMIEFLETKGHATADIYKELIDTANREISKCVLSQTTTTETAEHGNLATATVHQSGFGRVIGADCNALANTLNNQLIYPLLQFNFPNFRRIDAPRIRFNLDMASDGYKFMQMLDYAYRMGKPIHPEDFAKAGLTVKEGEELLQKPDISLEE